MTENTKKAKTNFIVVTFILAFVFSAYLYQAKYRNIITEKSPSQPIKIQEPFKNDQEDPNSDGYIPFTQEGFDSQKTKRRVLFFYAAWCTTCRPVNAEFLEDKNKIPEDVIVYRVNYKDSDTDETEKMLAEKYKITYQHTFVQVNQDGEVISKWNGGNLAELIKNVN